MQIQFEASGLDEIVRKCTSFNSDAAALIQQTILDTVEANVIPIAKALAPKKTGALVASISALPLAPPNVSLVADKSYAPFLEFGTRPHTITARAGGVLHWISKEGKGMFAKSVHHPGIPEGKFSFLRPALQEGVEDLVSAIEEMMVELFS